ncbi:MAG: FAD-binding oxidoreductase [Planctomycetota bacterium]
MKKNAEVVIIGGGVVGTAIAYNLAGIGVKDVVLVERDTLASGSTGRAAGGIRQQWSEPANVRLARASIDIFKNFKKTMGRDIGLVEGGYLLVAYTDEEVERFKVNIAMQRDVGADVRLVTPEEVRDIVPFYNTEGILAAAYCPDDCHGDPFLVTVGYAENAARLGAEINLRTEVRAIKKKGDRATTVVTSRGDINCNWVVNAAGGYSAEVGKMAGLDLPTVSYRHQILVTEPVQRILEPLVVDFHHGIYFCQSVHGAFISGQGDDDEPPGHDVRGSWRFMVEQAKKLTFLVPALKDISVVRQWAGLYNMSPDAQPILGRVPGVENFIVAIGFSGHGFMLAPIVGVLMAELIVHGEARTLPIDNLSITRFEKGIPSTREANVV